MLHLIYEENGYHRCTACRICEKACPNSSIKVLSRKGEITGKNELDRYIWRLDSCVFCNACVQSCPFNALEMGHEFENAVYDRRLLIFNLNRYAGPPASVLNKQPDLGDSQENDGTEGPLRRTCAFERHGNPGGAAPDGQTRTEARRYRMISDAAYTLLFYAISIITIVFALAVTMSRSLLRAAVYLMMVLLTSACLYIMLDAEFLAGIQVLVYVGGIVVLIVFAVMLTRSAELRLTGRRCAENFWRDSQACYSRQRQLVFSGHPGFR